MAGHTLLLDQNTWDLTLDGNGNIAVTTGAYGIAQNVANAIRLFTNDAWYDPQKGIPHFTVDLKTDPQESIIRSRFTRAALEVEGVASAEITALAIVDRVLTGNIILETVTGESADVAF